MAYIPYDTTVNIYRQIKAVCEYRDVRIGELERQIGVQTGYFSRRDRCGINITARVLLDACNVLEVSVLQLLKFDTRDVEIARLEREIYEREKELNKLRSERA